MAKPVVEITNLQEFLKDLRKLSPELANEVRRRFRKAARTVALDARAKAPRQSGRLARGIQPRVDSKGNAAIISKAPHARTVEFGGRHPLWGDRDRWVAQKAQPHIRPAVDENRDWFVREAEHAIHVVAQKAGYE